MLKSKKILSTLLAFIMFVSVGTTAFAVDLRSVSAENSNVLVNSNTDICGEHVLTPEEYNLYLQGLSEDEQNKINAKLAKTQKDEQNRINAKLAETQKGANQRLAQAATGTKISIPGTFTMYQQETDTYCIPATIKSILMYINGSSPSQSTIASTTGQDPTEIAPYLNDRQDDCYYVFVSSPSQSTMCSYLYSTIAYTEAPASMGISGTTTSNWYYATSGHSLVVNAIYDDYSYIQFGDPLGDKVAGCPYFYLKSASVANSVCTRIVY